MLATLIARAILISFNKNREVPVVSPLEYNRLYLQAHLKPLISSRLQ